MRIRLDLPVLLLLGGLATASPAQDFDATAHTAANPQNTAIQAAQAALEARDYAKAINLLKPLAAANPGDAKLLYDLGSAQDALDQTTPAEISYKAAIAADPTLLEPHLALGLLNARNGKTADAHAELFAATNIPNGDNLLKARAFRALARLDEAGHPEAARDDLLAALKLSPETPEDTLLAAELAARTGDTAPDAEKALRKLLAARPHDPEASASLARLLLQQKRNPDAELVLRDALDANPGDPVLTTQLATLLNAEDKPTDALPLVLKLHTAQPGDPNITHLLASLYIQTGDYTHAEPLFSALAAQSPQDVMLLDAQGDALIRLKRFAEAEQVLQRAVAQPKLFPTPADLGAVAGRLAFAASENNDPEGCLQALSTRATVLPTSPTTLFLEAISEDKLHQVKAAQQAYRKFLAVSNGAFPDQEFEAKHRLVALEHTR